MMVRAAAEEAKIRFESHWPQGPLVHVFVDGLADVFKIGMAIKDAGGDGRVLESSVTMARPVLEGADRERVAELLDWLWGSIREAAITAVHEDAG